MITHIDATNMDASRSSRCLLHAQHSVSAGARLRRRTMEVASEAMGTALPPFALAHAALAASLDLCSVGVVWREAFLGR